MAGLKVKREKESKSSQGRSTNCGRPARNWVTWRSPAYLSPGARSIGCVGQLKRWATVRLEAWQSGHVRSSAQPMGWVMSTSPVVMSGIIAALFPKLCDPSSLREISGALMTLSTLPSSCWGRISSGGPAPLESSDQ